MTFTTPLDLIAVNDHHPLPQEQSLFSALHFVPAAIDLTVPRLPPPRTPLDILTSLPAVRSRKPQLLLHLHEPPAPKPFSTPKPGRRITWLPVVLRASAPPHTLPFHPNLALWILTPPGGGGGQRSRLLH